jgi:recombination protein RecA
MAKEKNEKRDLEEAIEQIKKKFGEGAIMKLKEVKPSSCDVISTGSISLDLALGVGGLPRGRVVEIYGPESSGKTTIALHVLAEAQKQGGVGAFVDAEHALDPDYARRIGVKVEDLLISQPESGEEALEIVKTLIESGEVDVIVVDSVAALVPKSEIAGEMGEFEIGLQARLMSQALRVLSSSIAKTKSIVIFLNQIRTKIGCFQYNTRISMADGSTKKIGYLVNRKIKDKVLTYNFKTKKIEPKPIIGWFKNGRAEKFIQFVVEKCEGNGGSSFACTPAHKILTPEGYREAKDIKVGDKVLIAVSDWEPSSLQKELILGGLLGDGSLRPVGSSKFQYRETHSKDQDEYIKWKSNYFKNRTIGRHAASGLYFETFLSSNFENEYKEFYWGGKKCRIPPNIQLTPLSLAVWYQDDGYLANAQRKAINLSTGGFQKSSIKNLQNALSNQFNIRMGVREHNGGLELTFGQNETKKFLNICKYFIHPTIRYKVPNEYKNAEFRSPLKKYEVKKYIIREARVKAKYLKPKTKSMQKFDIETENHNYLVDGVIVHNSYGRPETTPGGLALKFYSSVRIELKRTAQIKKGEEIIGNKILAKIVKNKVAAPFKTAEFNIYYNEGISKFSDLINAGIKYGVIKKSGSWLQFENTKIGQGSESAKDFLKENQEIAQKIKEKILEVYSK